MSSRALLEDLRGRGVHLKTEGLRLHIDAPAEVVTDELRQQLAEHKHDLIRMPEQDHNQLEKANRRGLIIRWAESPGWIKLHDPLTGEWHEVRASECLPGVVETANKYRKKGGVA